MPSSIALAFKIFVLLYQRRQADYFMGVAMLSGQRSKGATSVCAWVSARESEVVCACVRECCLFVCLRLRVVCLCVCVCVLFVCVFAFVCCLFACLRLCVCDDNDRECVQCCGTLCGRRVLSLAVILMQNWFNGSH